jgi:hypothetical protein
MERRKLTRMTVDHDPSALPYVQGYADDGRRIWWDLNHMFASMQKHGENRRKKDWLTRCVEVCNANGMPDDIHKNTMDMPDDLIGNIATSRAAVSLLATSVDTGRINDVGTACCNYLVQSLRRVMDVPSVTRQFQVGQVFVTIDGVGRVGCLDVALASLSRRTLAVFKDMWDMAFSTNHVSVQFAQDKFHIVELLRVVLFCFKERRSQSRHRLSTAVVSQLNALRKSLLEWLASGIDKYVFDVYANMHDTSAPPIAFVNLHHRNGCRKYTRVDCDAIWGIMEDSIQTSTSMAQILKIRAADAHVQAHSASAGDRWMRKANNIYSERRGLGFSVGINHWNIVFDPATHSKKETAVSVIWSWEQNIGAFGDVQRMVSGSAVLEDEEAFPDRLAELARRRKLERVATYRQLQAVSNTMANLSSHRRITLNDFFLPSSVHARPVVGEDELRIVRSVGNKRYAFFYHRHTGALTRLMPDWFEDAQLLVLGIDEGSIGCAGDAYSTNIGALIHCRYDKFHRVVRDQKLSFTHAADGIFHKAQLYSSYLWAANKRPFGTGLVGDQKRRLLMVFLACESQDGPYFQKYGPKIAEDFGVPFNTDDEKLDVWKVIEALASCNQSGDTAKLSRWFSWNSIAHARMKEFHCEKMLLEHHLDNAVPDPDDNPIKFTEIERLAVSSSSIVGQLNAIKRAAGGLKLAYMLMSSWLLDVCKIMYIVLLASWTWYSFHVKNIKSPSDNVRYTIRMSRGAWARDDHLFDTIEQSFFSAKNLAFMGISTYDESARKQQKIDMEVDLVIHLLSNRAWSLAARHAIPPDTYSLAISSDPAQRQLGVDELQGDFRRLLKLEDLRSHNADAMLLWKEMITPKKFPIRLIYLFYERDAYDPSSSCGIRWMMGHVKIMPDNKVVEDCHNDIRRCANSNPNPVLSTGIAVVS